MAQTEERRKEDRYKYEGKLRLPSHIHAEILNYIGEGKDYEFMSDFIVDSVIDKLAKLKRRDRT